MSDSTGHESSASPALSIVIPAYNEEGCIEEVVKDWLGILEKAAPETGRLIVVNDGSRDSTGDILDRLASSYENLLIIHQPNSGHGSALLTGYRKAVELRSKWVFQVDSDNQFLSADFLKLWEKRKEADFVPGKREKREDPGHRLFISFIYRQLNFLLFGVRIEDANIPFRLYRGDYLAGLLSVLPGSVFAPNIFLSILAAKDGKKHAAIPVKHIARQTGTVSIVKLGLIKACFRTAGELLKFRLTLGKRLNDLRSHRHA